MSARVTLEFATPADACDWLRRARVTGADRVRLGRKIRTGIPATARVVGDDDSTPSWYQVTLDDLKENV